MNDRRTLRLDCLMLAVDVLAAGADVVMERARLLRGPKRSYLVVTRSGRYYVPYSPRYFRRAAAHRRR